MPALFEGQSLIIPIVAHNSERLYRITQWMKIVDIYQLLYIYPSKLLIKMIVQILFIIPFEDIGVFFGCFKLIDPCI